MQALAELYTNSDKLDTAILFYKRLLYTSVIENNEGIFAQALAQLVEIYKKQKRYAEANDLMKTMQLIDEQKFGVNSQTVSYDLNTLGFLSQKLGKHQDSITYYNKALEIDEKLYGAVHQEVAMDLNNMASVYNEIGQYDEAYKLYLRNLNIDEQLLGVDHPECEIDACNLVDVLKKLNRIPEAIALYEKMIDNIEKKSGTNNPKYA